MYKVIIIGASGKDGYDFCEKKCKYYLSSKAKSGEGIMILSFGSITDGKITGDLFNQKFSTKFHIDIQYYPCDFKAYGDRAPFKRRDQMIAAADAAIIFENEKSDVKHFIEEVIHQNMPYRYVKQNHA